MLGGPLIYCTLLCSFDFYLTGSSIYVYMSELVGRWIATPNLCFYIDKHVWSLKTALSSDMAFQLNYLSTPALDANIFILLTEISIYYCSINNLSK
jgi:hypothetical protein